MQKLAGLITESQFKQLVENDSIDIDTEYNEVILNSDSGEYTSEIKEDGSLTFELIFDDEGDIAYMNDKDIWDDFAPEVFKKIANADGDWYVDGDTVGVNTTLDKLKELFLSENSVNESEIKPTHRSNVDWYYIEEYSDYPGPKEGRTIPNDTRKYEDPTGYEGTELYVSEGTVGYIKNGKFIVASGKRKGNDVEYIEEYFEEISGNQVNEDDSIKLSYKDKQLIKRFQNWAVDNPTSTDVEFFSRRHSLTSAQQHLLKKVFLSGIKFDITSTGPLPSDTVPRLTSI